MDVLILRETVDALGGTNRFSYDGAGRPLVIQDANLNMIKASYNGFGHKMKVDDPNQGITQFYYNSLGELDKQVDANNVTQKFTLDTLGRMTKKVITGGNAPGTATYIWDTLKQGLLTQETANGVTRTYAYNAALQPTQTTVKVASSVGGDNVSRSIKYAYDGFFARPKSLTYPTGLTLEYRYNDVGYLTKTLNAASEYQYREVTEMDAMGHITGAGMINSLLTQTTLYNSEGTMASTEVMSDLGVLHQHFYDGYDAFMNLTSERNSITGLEKSYQYDDLNRLESYHFSNSGFSLYRFDSGPVFDLSIDYAYDAVGNILKKTDYSKDSNTAYVYNTLTSGNKKPNTISKITKRDGSVVNFGYDKRGNQTSGDGLTMRYNALDKPISITGRGPNNNTQTHFVYGSDGSRALQKRTVEGITTKTHYLDKAFEIDSNGGWRAYLSDAAGEDIAVLSFKGNTELTHESGITASAEHYQILFTLRDRLGSATTMVDHKANIVSQRYFDPFGRTATDTAEGLLGDLGLTDNNRRGFTDHEHLNEQQLIHMNGRVYDYNVGRFMSVDPLIQSPTSTQSINPYSYIMNNPLSGTDPTGYEAESQLSTKTVKVSVTGSRIKRSVKVTAKSDGNGGATVTFSGGTSSARKAVKAVVSASISGQGFQISNVGSTSGIAQGQGASGSGSGEASSSIELVGSIDKNILGRESRDAQKVYDKAYSFFENDENYEGEDIKFEDKYAVSIRNATNHAEVYKPRLFSDFEAANKYAGEKFREGYEKVWLNGYHFNGQSFIYKIVTFSRGQLSGVERTLATMAHESRHYNKFAPGRARPHNTAREKMAFQLRSEATVNRYRSTKNGDTK